MDTSPSAADLTARGDHGSPVPLTAGVKCGTNGGAKGGTKGGGPKKSHQAMHGHEDDDDDRGGEEDEGEEAPVAKPRAPGKPRVV